jgi:hypothetical protein
MDEALWRCPVCMRLFANRNQTHMCAPPRTLDEHFAGRIPDVVATYRAFEAAARANGPMVVIPEKTRIAFQVRNELRGREAEETLGRRTRRSRPQARERTFSLH